MGKEIPFATSHRDVYKILSKIFQKYIGFIGEKKTHKFWPISQENWDLKLTYWQRVGVMLFPMGRKFVLSGKESKAIYCVCGIKNSQGGKQLG